MKRSFHRVTFSFVYWFKASETLLGIETMQLYRKLGMSFDGIQSLWNPFRDWNILWLTWVKISYRIQSLWNPFRDWNQIGGLKCLRLNGFKASETLLGIETQKSVIF